MSYLVDSPYSEIVDIDRSSYMSYLVVIIYSELVDIDRS